MADYEALDWDAAAYSQARYRGAWADDEAELARYDELADRLAREEGRRR
jgi:hypothetical protein